MASGNDRASSAPWLVSTPAFVPKPLRDTFSFGQLERLEDAAQSDMQIRGVRLTRFAAEKEGKVWREQDNGEWWLVPVIEA